MNIIEKLEAKQKEKHLSISQVNTYIRCPRQFFYSYILNIKQPPSGAMIAGSSNAKALEQGYKEMMADGKMGPGILSVMVDLWHDYWVESSRQVEWFKEKEKKDAIENSSLAVLELYGKDEMPSQEPIAVEEKIQTEIMGRPFIGYIDLVETKIKITDHKLSGKKYQESRGPKNSLQLNFYAHCKKTTNVNLDILVRKSNPEIQRLTNRLSKQNIELSLGKIKLVAKKIMELEKITDDIGIVWSVPDPTSWQCSEKYCGYYKACQRDLREINKRLK